MREVLGVADATYDQIDTVVIGTTQFANAFVERRHLNPVGILRLCLPSAEDIAPMLNWPDDLRGAVGGNVYLLPGGYEFDGRAISPFDEMAVAEAVKTIKSRGITSFAVSSVCSPVNAAMEKCADFARGAAFLGAGGGGDPYLEYLTLSQQMQANGPLRIVQPSELNDDDFIVPVGLMGAPTVVTE
ncbi:S-methyl thiohydantoin desulfurase domain-containing protein [Endozoicomonas euniceicola]|uniref:DUF917 family protein n=1 Tax=Endozoicomonas euniceicola TaxID=1234143 RepID=A0ABY6H1C1_9GAMM|nr:DUF917 family protein [Endozoicomonas euniceicola]UYM18854.1 DUF917 family protein [Endozoicomonas euniceicola]